MTRFIGNDESRKVHSDDCEYALSMHPRKVVCFDEIYHAISQGFEECQFCLGEGREVEIGAAFLHKTKSRVFAECICCGEHRGVQQAHIVPRRFGGVATMPLCPNCHWNYDHGLLNDAESNAIKAALPRFSQGATA